MNSAAAIPVDQTQDPNWGGHRWSGWHQLDVAIAPRIAGAPDTAGVYRIRCKGRAGLIYIGETGDSLRNRFRQLRKATVYVTQGKPPGPPHVAGACVLGYERAGFTVEVSWLEKPDLDTRDRKGMECDLIAAYRTIMSASPPCQFGGCCDASGVTTA